MSQVTFRAVNFRALERLEWCPEGVCLLAGANGAGKTTVLGTLAFLRELFERGHESAFATVDGDNFARLGADPSEPVEFEVEVGEIRWKLRFPMSSSGLRGTYGEELYRKDSPILRAAMFQSEWYFGKRTMTFSDFRSCARTIWDQGESAWMAPLVSALKGIRTYGPMSLDHVRYPQRADAPASVLHSSGKNLWALLSKWKNAPLRYPGQYDWVISHARRAFPDTLGTIEFDRGQAFLYGPRATDAADGLPPSRAADGLLTGLLQLTALAGAEDGSIVAFDEVENQLHPYAIRSIVASARERADERDLTVILTTHSPVVMNAFHSEPNRFFVLQPGRSSQPVRLTDLHDEDWLSAFCLGDLYDRLEFAAPGPPFKGESP